MENFFSSSLLWVISCYTSETRRNLKGYTSGHGYKRKAKNKLLCPIFLVFLFIFKIQWPYENVTSLTKLILYILWHFFQLLLHSFCFVLLCWYNNFFLVSHFLYIIIVWREKCIISLKHFVWLRQKVFFLFLSFLKCFIISEVFFLKNIQKCCRFLLLCWLL